MATPFSRDIRQLLRSGARSPNGEYHYNPAIESMFITMGINHIPGARPEAIAFINTEKFRIIRQIQVLLTNYDRGDFGHLLNQVRLGRQIHRENEAEAMDVRVYQDLISTHTMRFVTQGRVQIKLFHYLASIYNNPAFFQALNGRFPLKVIIAVDGILAVPKLVNNAGEFRNLILTAFFSLMGQADFYNAQHGQGIDYADDAVPDDGDRNIEEDAFGNLVGAQPEQAPVLDRFRGENITMIVMQLARRLRGRYMPKQLRLDPSIANSVINPKNEDAYCLIWALLIASRIMYNPEVYKKITKKTSLNNIEKFPALQQGFDELFDDFDALYDENDNIPITTETLEELEVLFNININIYYMVNGRASIVLRSTFANVQTENVARILFVPYSSMLPAQAKSNVKAYKLGTKSDSDFAQEIENDTFFDLNDGHFCLLPLNSQLLTGEIASDNYYTCPTCDSIFQGEPLFLTHKKTCLRFQVDADTIVPRMLPNPVGSSQRFTKYHTLSKSPFVLYGDTESQTDGTGHRLFSFFIFVKHESDESLNLYLSGKATKEEQVGEQMVSRFVKALTLVRIHLRKHTNLYPHLDPEEFEDFVENNERVCCQFCKKVPINTKTKHEDPDCLVVHHDHNRPSPNIVGYLCRSCNIAEAKINNSFPIFFHNLPYDLLVLIKMLAVKSTRIRHDGEMVTVLLEGKSSVLAKTSMKYSSLTLNREKAICQRDDTSTFMLDLPEIRFTDSLAFLQSSLGDVVDTLKKSSTDLKSTFASTYQWLQSDYPDVAEELFELSTEKGIIAYSHTSVENMKRKTNLPIHFYKNDLDLTEEYLLELEEKNPELAAQLKENAEEKAAVLAGDYGHSNHIFKILKKQFGAEMSYGIYFMYYQALDVLLLSDVMTNFRNTLIATHKLEPAWFIGLPGYSQNCMLYLTNTVLHYIPENLKLSKLITSNLRGGLSVILNKNAEETPGKHISGIDVNNLYGYVMNQKIANKYLEEITPEEFEAEIEEIGYSAEGDYAYFCLVDVDASDAVLQDRVAKLPPLVSSQKIDYSMLSAEQAAYRKENYRSSKLCCTLEDQKDYLMNYDNLLFYRRLGYKIKIKTVHVFEKEYIYKDYIDINSKLRQACKSDFEKGLYKALNVIIYGKSLQRNDLHTNIEILSSKNLIFKRLVNPRLKSLEIIKDNELVMTNTIPEEAKFDVCAQAGYHILELSKLHLYSMIYEKILPFCEEHNVGTRFLLSDTDSLYHELDFTNSAFPCYAQYTAAISKATNIFDNHAWLNPLVKDTSRKKQVGLFLDEEADQISIIGYVGLCSKSYCLLMRAEVDHPVGYTKKLKGDVWLKAKGKGVPTRYLRALYQYQDFKDCAEGLLSQSRTKIEFRNIQRHKYQNTTKTIRKNALSSFDDKMFHWKDAGVWKSLPHGHYRIAELLNQEEEDLEEALEIAE